MKRRDFLKTMGVGLAAMALPGCAHGLRQPKARKGLPNFVIIFTDDQGYADVECYGAKGFQTPNLDKLAAEGMRFTDFYVSQAVCSASRAALMTGCYSNRVSILGALNHTAQHGINADEETIAEVLKKKNYATGIFGKWHLGHHKKFLPLQHGFDEYLGLPYSNDMWPVDYDGTPLTQDNKGSKSWRANYPILPLIDGNETVEHIRTLEDQATLTTRYTERAVKFIEKNKDQPFFLYVPHSMPHVPLGVSDKFKGKSEQGMYGDVIMEIDWSVGQIMKTLQKNGLDDNTLVVFATDNGPWMNFGNHAGSALPLREGKGTMWDGGARVPCIMRWPGKIKAGSECNKMAATIDILPTLAAITGADLPKNKIDGVNILSLMEGKKGAAPRDYYFFYYGKELQAVRQGKWKLHFPHEYRTYKGFEPGKDGWPGKTGTGKTSLELYNLENDISETTNVADKYPKVVKRLQTLAEKAREDIGDSLTRQKGQNVRSPGKIPEENNSSK
jgi:arylsulfatase A-like enzyme